MKYCIYCLLVLLFASAITNVDGQKEEMDEDDEHFETKSSVKMNLGTEVAGRNGELQDVEGFTPDNCWVGSSSHEDLGNKLNTKDALSGPKEIYQSNRYCNDCDVYLSYPVQNCKYSVILHWAAIDKKRNDGTFHVLLENERYETNLNVIKKVGMDKAYVRKYEVDVTDHRLDILLERIDDTPFISGVEFECMTPMDGALSISKATGAIVDNHNDDNNLLQNECCSIKCYPTTCGTCAKNELEAHIISEDCSGKDFKLMWNGKHGGAWSKLDNIPKSVGDNSGAIVIHPKRGKVILTFGSYWKTDAYAYYFDKNEWETFSAPPIHGDHMEAVVYKNLVYVFGGDWQEGTANKVQIYNIAKDKWVFGRNMPWNMGAGNAELISDKMYICGGFGNKGEGTSKNCGIYDPELHKWSKMKDMPYGRNHAAYGTDGEKLFIMTGRGIDDNKKNGDTLGFSLGYDTVQIYDPRTDSWETSRDENAWIKPSPVPRAGVTVALYIDGEFWLIGGSSKQPAPNACIKLGPNYLYYRTDIYNPRTNTWREGADMHFAAGATTPLLDLESRKVYLPGGATRENKSKPGAVFQVLDIDTALTYMTPPASEGGNGGVKTGGFSAKGGGIDSLNAYVPIKNKTIKDENCEVAAVYLVDTNVKNIMEQDLRDAYFIAQIVGTDLRSDGGDKKVHTLNVKSLSEYAFIAQLNSQSDPGDNSVKRLVSVKFDDGIGIQTESRAPFALDGDIPALFEPGKRVFLDRVANACEVMTIKIWAELPNKDRCGNEVVVNVMFQPEDQSCDSPASQTKGFLR